MLIERRFYLDKIAHHFKSHPVVALMGPRQSGKTTLARQYAASVSSPAFFDLEDVRDTAALSNPYLALESLQGLIIIDEIQRLPELFATLRVLVDQKKEQRFLILGSASPELMRQSSESLAGRIAYVDTYPFSLQEVDDCNRLHILGGFPNSYLYPETAFDWIEQYIRTFLEKDIPALGFSLPALTMRRFWSMLSHYHANIFNASEIGRSLGISDHTVKKYLDILSGTFMIRQLYPWFENIQKRQIKRPKIYFMDSGIFHHLIDIHHYDQLLRHAKSGASFEGFALEQVIRLFNKRSEECYYWGIHQEGEIDLIIHHQGKKLGFEFKFSESPQLTTSMHKALTYLKLDMIYVIYPGQRHYMLDKQIEVYPLKDLNTLRTSI